MVGTKPLQFNAPVITFLVIASLLAYFYVPQFGANWDLALHLVYGEAMWEIINKNLPISAFGSSDIVYYPPLLDLIGHGIIRTFNTDPVLTRNTMSAFFWILGLPPLLWLAKRLGGKQAQWFVGIAYIVNPVIFGHGMMNHKDIPMATMLLWFILSLTCPPQKAWLRIFVQGLCFGGLLIARPGALVFSILLLLQLRLNKPLLPQVLQILGPIILAYALLVGSWPYCYDSPIIKPIRAILFNLSFPDTHATTFFGYIKSTELPRYYLPLYLLISVPIAQLLSLPIGMLGQVKLKRYALAALILPILGFIISPPNIYGGIRHMLFLFPLIALFAGLGISKLTSKYYTLGVALLLLPIGSMLQTTPYQYTYYSPIVNIFGRENFERDYWGLGFEEAAKYLNSISQPSDKIYVFANTLGINCFLLSYKYPEQVIGIWPDPGKKHTEPWPKKLPNSIRFFVSLPQQSQEAFIGEPVLWTEGLHNIEFITIRGQ